MKKMNSKAITLLLMACLACQCLTGCGQNTSTDKKAEATQSADATPGAEATPAGEDNAATDGEAAKTDAAEGVISFSGYDLDGNEIDSASVFSKAKLTMVNVWATTCPPCINELAELENLNNEWKLQDMQVVGLLYDGVDESGAYSKEMSELGKQILQDKGATYQNITCKVDSFKDLIDMSATPTTFFVDQNGKMVGEVQVGVVDKDEYNKLAQKALEEIK